MSKERNAFKAGIFIIISIALIIGVIVAIKGVGEFLEPNQVRVAKFKLTDDLGGLRVGDDVRVGGVKVGIVRSIEIDTNAKTDESNLLVKFQIPERLKIKNGASVGVQSTLTGASWINFDNLGAGAALAQNEPLVGTPNPMTTLFASFGEAGPEIAAAAKDLRSITIPKVNTAVDSFKDTGKQSAETIASIKSRLDTIVGKWYTLADTATAALANVRDLFGETKGDFRTTIANLSASTGDIRKQLPSILKRLDDVIAKTQTSMDTVQASLEDIKKTASNTKELTAEARSVIVRNRGKFDEMIASAKTAGDNLKFATAEIRRSPWRLLYKPKPGEMANLNLYDSARQFAEGANDLSDAATALRDALNDPNVDKKKLDPLIDKLDKTFSGFQTVEKELWDRVKE